jgi:hypothetical protein
MGKPRRIAGPALAGAALLLAAASSLRPQFLPSEISRRAFWEDYLRTARIVRSEPVGEGVTAPLKLYFLKDGVEAKGVWKSIDTTVDGCPDHWHGEIAAYELDKRLGLNMVPPAVELVVEGRRGAVSLWAESRASLLKVVEERLAVPDEAAGRIDAAKYLTRAWDSLIANDDRTQQNVLYTADWRTVLIDHSRAFVSDREHRRRLIYGAGGIKTMDDGAGGRRPALFRRLPRAFVERLRLLDLDAVRQAAGPWLSETEMEAVVERAGLLLAEIEAAVRRDGEDKVLY